MRVVGVYSFNGGREYVSQNHPEEVGELLAVIAAVKAEDHKVKVSKEKTMPGRLLYSPFGLNRGFKEHFTPQGWVHRKVLATYSTDHYVPGYEPSSRKAESQSPYRDMDFLKNGLGIEVQFGKYSFMVYNVCAKMTIFSNMGFIDSGVEIVPVKAFAEEMSTGVSYFEQFVWDLEHRGVADIDVPVLILGIDADGSAPDLQLAGAARAMIFGRPERAGA